MRQDTFEDPELDPWGSPVTNRDRQNTHEQRHGPSVNGLPPPMGPVVNGMTSNPISGFNSQTRSAADNHQAGESAETPSGNVATGWGEGFGTQRSESFENQGNSGLSGGFGQSGDDQGNNRRSNSFSRSLGGGGVNNAGNEDVITIHMLPEKEGMFMFQHRNYEVKSVRKASSVIRRYSDFVWLVDCLQKRYPFRQIPLLPPKRIAGTLRLVESSPSS